MDFEFSCLFNHNPNPPEARNCPVLQKDSPDVEQAARPAMPAVPPAGLGLRCSVLQQLHFFSAWKDRCGTGRQCAPASLTQSRKDAKECLEVFAPWRLGVRQSVGFGRGSAAEWGRPSPLVACRGAGRQACNAGGPTGRVRGPAPLRPGRRPSMPRVPLWFLRTPSTATGWRP
jgi:hypothetical protein